MEGYPEEVASAIEEQYLPRYADDELPKSLPGKYLSIIDKLTTLTLSIASGIEYTSSKDPFGLRKHALGIVQVTLSLDSNEFPLEELVNYILDISPLKIDLVSIKNEVVTLLKERANSFIKVRV